MDMSVEEPPLSSSWKRKKEIFFLIFIPDTLVELCFYIVTGLKVSLFSLHISIDLVAVVELGVKRVLDQVVAAQRVIP